MKGLAGIVLIGAFAAVGWLVFGDMLAGGGSVDPGSVQPPDVPVPDVNDAADRAQDGANTAADEVSSWTPETWKVIVLALIATAATVLWFRSAKFKWAVIGVGIALMAVVAFA